MEFGAANVENFGIKHQHFTTFDRIYIIVIFNSSIEHGCVCMRVQMCLSVCLNGCVTSMKPIFKIEKISHGFYFISFYFFKCIPPHLLSDYHPKNFFKHIIHITTAILLAAWRHFFPFFVSQFLRRSERKTEMLKGALDLWELQLEPVLGLGVELEAEVRVQMHPKYS